MRRFVYILYSVVVLLLTACAFSNGSVLIRENISGTGCKIDFMEWSQQNKCELSFDKDDELQVEIECSKGSIALDIRSKSGAEAYKGNGLDKAVFTVKVPEEGEYVISFKGTDATGSINISVVE
ncbi:MAG TPA: hypothetical protein GXX26_03240 [Clostridiaceae bacterium]|nr:hypothetical protein [Clostridiaceae bacterium]